MDRQQGYTYKYNGGCATSTESYPSKIKSQQKDSTQACYSFCKMTSNCEYFEYDSSGKWCHLHPSGITRGNGYPNVKCYKSNCKDQIKNCHIIVGLSGGCGPSSLIVCFKTCGVC